MNVLPARESSIEEAARVLRGGGLVVVPTETVYGLAANALDAEAVKRLFVAKGRPLGHPLISHIAGQEQATRVVSEWPEMADRLAKAFWPGPLTLVLPKSEDLPAIVTGSLPTAAVRMPSHKVFRAVLLAAAVPLAAPSANSFTAISPTRVEHLSAAMLEAAGLVLDGGPCEFGIESTVIDLSEQTPRLLRPGAISAADIEKVLKLEILEGDLRKSPGSHPKHYSPRARLSIVVDAAGRPGLVFGNAGQNQISMPEIAEAYAAQLYDALHTLDGLGLADIWVETPPQTAEWDAIWDRLRRASSAG